MRLNLRSNRQPWSNRQNYENGLFSSWQGSLSHTDAHIQISPHFYNGITSKPKRYLGTETPDYGKVVISSKPTRLLVKSKKKTKRYSDTRTYRPKLQKSRSNPVYGRSLSYTSGQEEIPSNVGAPEFSSRRLSCPDDLETAPLRLAASVSSLYDGTQYHEFKKQLQRHPSLLQKVDYFTNYYKHLLNKEFSDEIYLVRELIIVTIYNKLCLDLHLESHNVKDFSGEVQDKFQRNHMFSSNGSSQPKSRKVDATVQTISCEENYSTSDSSNEYYYHQTESDSDCLSDSDESPIRYSLPRGRCWQVRASKRESEVCTKPIEAWCNEAFRGGVSFSANSTSRTSVFARNSFCEDRFSDDDSVCLNANCLQCGKYLDHDFRELHDERDCTMPCKTSSIPVYQRPGGTLSKNVTRINLNSNIQNYGKQCDKTDKKSNKNINNELNSKIPTCSQVKKRSQISPVNEIKNSFKVSSKNGASGARLSPRIEPKKITSTPKSNLKNTRTTLFPSHDTSKTNKVSATEHKNGNCNKKCNNISASSSGTNLSVKKSSASRSPATQRNSNTVKSPIQKVKPPNIHSPLKDKINHSKKPLTTVEPRAKIVRRVMTTNQIPKSNISKLKVTRQAPTTKLNIFEERNTLCRSSAESRTTESTGDSGCNSPSNDSSEAESARNSPVDLNKINTSNKRIPTPHQSNNKSLQKTHNHGTTTRVHQTTSEKNKQPKNYSMKTSTNNKVVDHSMQPNHKIKTFAKADSFMQRYNDIPVGKNVSRSPSRSTSTNRERDQTVKKAISVSINVKSPSPKHNSDSSDDSDSTIHTDLVSSDQNNLHLDENSKNSRLSLIAMDESLMFIDADEHESHVNEMQPFDSSCNLEIYESIPFVDHSRPSDFQESESPMVIPSNSYSKESTDLPISLSNIIDSKALKNLDGAILEEQFDAIIHTLKKVAASMDSDDHIMQQENAREMIEQSYKKLSQLQHGSKTSLKEMKHADNKIIEFYQTPSLGKLQSDGSYNFGARSTISLNQESDCSNDSTKKQFRKVNSALNIRKNSSDMFLEANGLKKSLSKSKELLSQLELEYSLLRGEPNHTTLSSNPNGANELESKERISYNKQCNSISNKGGIPLLEKLRISKNGTQNQKPKSADGRHMFSFFSKKNRKFSVKHDDLNKSIALDPVYMSNNDYFQRQCESPSLPPDKVILENCDPDYSDDGSSFSHRSLSLPKTFLSDQYGTPAINGVSFPWRADDEKEKDDTEYTKVRYRKQSDQTGIRKSSHASTISRTLRKEKTNSSPPLSRSSLSHSEWDIHRQWSPESNEKGSLSQSVCRLVDSSFDQITVDDTNADNTQNDGSCTNDQSQNSSGVFQKFKKSLSLRLAKKNSRSDAEDSRPGSAGLVGASIIESGPTTLPRRTASDPKEEKSNFLFGHPIFRSSKERRKAKLRDARASKCNSADSGDSGIEIVSGASTLTGYGSPNTNFDSQFQELNTQSNSERCASQTTNRNDQNLHIRRTCSDIGGTIIGQGRGLYVDNANRQFARQYSSPQPIKTRPLHRLPNYSTSNIRNRLKRTKGSAHLRRSVSQPLDLNKSFEAQHTSVQNYSEEDSVSKRLRRPSVGNLLSDENTSEEDIHASGDESTGLTKTTEDKQWYDPGVWRLSFKTPLVGLDAIKAYSSVYERSRIYFDLILYAEALWDHVSLDADELVFKAGDLVTVIDRSDKDWWWGRITKRLGWFPAAFVRLLVNQEDHLDKVDALKSGDDWENRKSSLGGVSSEQIRANVVNEIISTERDFVKHLNDVIEGYLKQIRKRPDMFSEESIMTIFGNLEALYSFQSDFLKELETCIDHEHPHLSCIGECFIRNRARFEIYSEYCNNHPAAVSALQELYQNPKFVHFLEACRLLQEMIDISLDGFLLTPVQKICKYPLQLQELLKYTKPNHPDYVNVGGAMQAMREVALLVNERKRRMECLEKIASWQTGVEGWEGPDLLDDSTQLIHQGEVTKGVGGSWPKEVYLFLFDHQLIYCKKDLLKRNTYVYRGRINMDLCEVIDIPDAKDSSKGSTIYHAWKILCLGKTKNYIFSSKTATEKEKWLAAFRKERKLVAADEEAGFVVSARQKQSARIAARNSKNRPKKPRSKSRTQEMTFAQAKRLVNTDVDDESKSNSLPSNSNPPDSKKKSMWFPFTVHKKSKSGRHNVQQNPS